MKHFLFIAAILLIPPALSPELIEGSKRSQCGATDYFVKRNGCFVRVAAPSHHAPRYVAPAAAVYQPSSSVAQSLVTLAKEKQEWQIINQTINQLFGTPTSYAGPLGASGGYAAPQVGNTQYGYSVQSFATVTPQPLDVEALMERATRLATQAQNYGADATAQAQGLLGQAQAGQQAIAQTFAQAARELSVLEALKPIQPQEVQAQTQYTATASATSSEAQPAATATAQVVPNAQPQFAALVAHRCATCHDAESPAGGLNLAGDVSAFDQPRLLNMLARVSTGDVSKRMPKDAEPLSDAELLLFVKAIGAKE